MVLLPDGISVHGAADDIEDRKHETDEACDREAAVGKIDDHGDKREYGWNDAGRDEITALPGSPLFLRPTILRINSSTLTISKITVATISILPTAVRSLRPPP